MDYDNHASDYIDEQHGKSSLQTKDKKKHKRYRSAFTTAQVGILEDEFKKNPYVSNGQREKFAKLLHLSERAVKIWFQNRRMKEKREAKPESDIKSVTNNHFSPISHYKKLFQSPRELTETKTIIQKCPEDSKFAYNVTLVTSDQTKELIICKTDNEIPSLKNTPTPLDKKPIMEKNSASKQPVGHILPFSKIKAPASKPQRAPENLTTNIRPTLPEHCVKDDSQHSSVKDPLPATPVSNTAGYFPLDLSKYYTSIPPMNEPRWNAYNYIPVIQPGVPICADPSLLPRELSSAAVRQTDKQCSCNCHSDSAESMYKLQMPPYPVFYTPQYIPQMLAPYLPRNAENN